MPFKAKLAPLLPAVGHRGNTSMNQAELLQRLSQIPTSHDWVHKLHHGTPQEQQAARHWFVERYRTAIQRYLLGIAKDTTTGDELFQDFMVRVFEGKLSGFDAQQGKFRHYLKRSLSNLATDCWRKRQPLPLPEEGWQPADPRLSEIAALEEEFDRNLGAEIVRRAMAQLQSEEERQTPKRFLSTVLRCYLDHADLNSDALAAQLTAAVGKAVDGGWVRKRLHFARQQLADLIVDAVWQMLPPPATLEALEEELADLGLLEHCKVRLEEGGAARQGRRSAK
jgi:DNA-directed RNA polymerase specialized sigma24 family protein